MSVPLSNLEVNISLGQLTHFILFILSVVWFIANVHNFCLREVENDNTVMVCKVATCKIFLICFLDCMPYLVWL